MIVVIQTLIRLARVSIAGILLYRVMLRGWERDGSCSFGEKFFMNFQMNS